MNPRQLLLDSFRAAVAAADPLRIVAPHLPKPPRGKTLVVGAGKAAAAMALAVERYWPAGAPLNGVVITRYGHGRPVDTALTQPPGAGGRAKARCPQTGGFAANVSARPARRIRVVEAGHPVPDEAGEAAAREILDEVKKLGRNDLLLCLVSGGGSSLLSLPVPGVSMANLKGVTKELLRCGAAVQEMNTVRKHLSAVQGGRLAAVCSAPVLALVISDVTGDDPAHIASGPCAPDPTTYTDALAILERYGVKAAPAVTDRLIAGIQGRLDETPKPGDPFFRKVENRVIATAHASLVAAGHFFRSHGIAAAILGDSVTGESREVAKVYAALAKEVRVYGHPWKTPVALICGGETTVTVRGNGRGGRCTEFLLSLAIELEGAKKVYALAADTDGIDGSEDNAGAILTPDSLRRGAKLGMQPAKLLANNDGYGFFEKLDDLVITGPTRTNVNDYRVILVL